MLKHGITFLEKKLQANDDNIRRFRKQVISADSSDLNSLKSFRDFFLLSECRDLCFHKQEHRFTTKGLQETLQSNELKFLVFIVQQPVKSLYHQYFPDDEKQTNLQNWENSEEKHPNTFVGMYQFWVSKNLYLNMQKYLSFEVCLLVQLIIFYLH